MRVSQIRQREPFLRSPRWPAVAIAVAILLLVQPAAGAAGFGSLRVRSNLGQPLQAEIDLIGITEQEGQHLAVRLASAEAYQRAGLTYNPIVSTLRASLVRSSDGGYVVRIRSAQPIGEPIVDILVDLTWGSGRLSRAYTFLLDPAGPANTVQVAAPAAVVQAAAPTAAASVPAPATASRSRAPVPPASLPTARPARQTRQAARPQPAAPAADTAPGRTYTVRRGDSLYDIASNAVPGQDAASLNRTLLALHHDNPGAFVGGNINRLRVGSVLKLPPAVNTLIVSVRESRQEGAEQTAGLAGDRSRATADADAARQRIGSGPARMRDQAASPAGVVPAAEDPALKAMESRVAELEKNLTEMQRQLALKNEELAKLAAAQMAASTPAPSTRAPASAPAAQAPAPIAPAAPIEAATVAPAPVAEASAPAAPGNAPAAVRPHARQTSWFWSLLGNPMVLGLVALLGGWAVYRRSQPKPERAHGFQNSLLSREHTVIANANSLFGPAGAQNIDTAQHSVFGADFRVGGGGDNNDVDPIAEADVYIAYGRDVQAEEILRETLVQQPERMAIRFKLLDIYANRQDAQGFQSVAEDLLARVGAASPEWAEAAALGRTIDPDNPLYLTVQGDTLPAQAQVQAQAAPEPVAPVPEPEADTAAAEALEALEALEAPKAAEAAETDDLPRPSTALVPQDPGTAPSAPSAKTPPSADLELLP
ncbi:MULTISPECIES: type IV pilus assembly protein FimV [Ralstonia solanacearum species complex]|uniref:Pilus assembly protein n=1 Tax=Ralstonia solanacearum K60 TaxID=1091042 RepID=A0AAP7ZHD4_RALSL|nr:FimV/HubP family polar landmark protein [Ralstonia solanacearum]OYQ09060.1 pilus assembly protein [Ralstonia solanacearum K60]